MCITDFWTVRDRKKDVKDKANSKNGRVIAGGSICFLHLMNVLHLLHVSPLFLHLHHSYHHGGHVRSSFASHLDIPFDVMAETFADHVNLTYATRSFHVRSFTPYTQVLISDSGHRTQTQTRS